MIKALEFRKKDGSYVAEFLGDLATIAYKNLCCSPVFVKEEMKIKNKGTFVVFRCVKKEGYIFGGAISLIFDEGDYIKLIA